MSPPSPAPNPNSARPNNPAPAGPDPVAFAMDHLPETLCRDGYRCNLVVTQSQMTVLGQLFVDGQMVADVPIWTGLHNDASDVMADRLLPVITAVCRFLNTATGSGALPRVSDQLALVLTVIGRLAGLPTWQLTGVDYMMRSEDGADVVYDIPGKSRALRIVEDQFAEILDADALHEWVEDTNGFVPDLDEEECTHDNAVLDTEDPSRYRCPDCGAVFAE
jgi:hypothetical protein